MPTNPPSKSSSFVRVADFLQTEQFRVESLEMIPKLLVERFGEPSPGDSNKVSGMFIFADEQGNVFSIYDWMMTSPRGSTDVGFSPDDFWGLGEIVPLQIGGNSHNRELLNKFLSWFDCALADGLQADQGWLAALPAEPCSAEAQERLLQLVEKGDAKTQLAALEAIRRIGEPIATPKLFEKLLRLLHLPQPVRPTALRSISAFAGLSHTSWVQSRIIEQLNSQSASTRCNGLSALGRLGASVWSDAILARFVELLMEEPTAAHALLLMTWVRPGNTPPPTPDVISRVAQQLSNPNAEIRQFAAGAVVTLGKPAAVLDVLTPMFRVLGEADTRTREAAEMSFQRLGEIAAIPGFVSHLCQSIRPEDFQVQASALRVVTGRSQRGENSIRRKQIPRGRSEHGPSTRHPRVPSQHAPPHFHHVVPGISRLADLLNCRLII